MRLVLVLLTAALLATPSQQAELAEKLGLPSVVGVTVPMRSVVVVFDRRPWVLKLRLSSPSMELSYEEQLGRVLGWTAFPCPGGPDAGGKLPTIRVPPEGQPPQARS